MNMIKLSCTDAELSAAVAAHVAGEPPKHRYHETSDSDYCVNCGHELWQDDRPCRIPYATSDDALIPLLEKHPSVAIDFSRHLVPDVRWKVAIAIPGPGQAFALDYGATFARAACFALLRVAGVEIVP